ncbi:MAG: hypothetical protein ACLRT5_18510 [Lachnospiraceae bacterium]
MNDVEYLIISSTIDFSTDLVCYQLMMSGEKFYRLNRDEFIKHNIVVDLQKKSMMISIEDEEYNIQFEQLKGVFYRAPVFLRTQAKAELSVQEQLERNQWSSFLRNLIIFQNANWINNPVYTYRAENKMFQLCVAESCGLQIPKTYVSNISVNMLEREKKYIVKSLDTALFYDTQNNKEMFTYSNVVSGEELQDYELASAPIIIQEFLNPKVDCRVTYIQGKLFPVKILQNGEGLYGDWRLRKDELEYVPFQLPPNISVAICKLMQKLEIQFGGIDLAIVGEKYFFIEVNPTGEWGWLEIKTGMQISQTIKKALCGE